MKLAMPLSRAALVMSVIDVPFRSACDPAHANSHLWACTLTATGRRGAIWSSVILEKRVANRVAAAAMVSTITALTFFSTSKSACAMRFHVVDGGRGMDTQALAQVPPA